MKIKLIVFLICVLLITVSSIQALRSDYINKSEVNNFSNINIKNYNMISDEIEINTNEINDVANELIYNKHKSRIFDLLNRFNDFRFGKSELNRNNYIDYLKSDHDSDFKDIRNIFKLYQLSGIYSVKGYIRDSLTNLPIDKAEIIIVYPGDRYSIAHEITESDTNGFYNINFEWEDQILLGGCRLIVKNNGYFDKILDIEHYLIDNEQADPIWLNVTLDFGAPPKNSIICGYITEMETNDPIENADLDFFYYATNGGYISWDYIKSDSSGYYELSVFEGSYDFWLHSDNHYYNDFIFIGDNILDDIGENETICYNLSLLARPEENSVIKGIIRDDKTDEPIDEAVVLCIWFSNIYMFDIDWAISDASGNYELNVPQGYPPQTICYHIDYHENFLFHYKEIEEYDTVRMNFYLYPSFNPDLNSIVNGYVKDKITDHPIENAQVRVTCIFDDQSPYSYYNYYDNTTYTDSDGFYSMEIPAGEVYARSSALDYFYEYSDHYVVDEYETISIDFSLDPRPPETSVICGYITDEVTKEPLSDVRVRKHMQVSSSHYYDNTTSTDSSGFFILDTAAGKFDLSAYLYSSQYFETETGWLNFEIFDYETLWINLTLRPHPVETSEIKGVVKYVSNQQPVKYAIIVYTYNNQDDYYSNVTVTDSSGYYEIDVAEGGFDLIIGSAGYEDYKISDNISDGETKLINTALEKFCAHLVKPIKGLYINDTRLLPFLFLPIDTPIIIGDIEVILNCSYYEPYGSPDVLFYVDDRLKSDEHYWQTDVYNWTWDEKSFGKHKLKVIALTHGYFWYNIAGVEIFVWKFF